MEEERKRHARSIKVTSNIADIFDFFKGKYPQHNLNRKQFADTSNLINKKIANSIIKKSFELRMPYRLGFLRVKAFKQNIKFTEDGKLDTQKNPIDWKATKDLWKELYPNKTAAELKAIPNKKLIVHVNEHSNGYTMKWHWDRRTSNLVNQSVYVFKAVKGIQDSSYYEDEDCYHYGKRGLAKWINSEDRTNEYYN